MKFNKISDSLYQFFLSEKNKRNIERVFLLVAIGSFILHLLIIGCVHLNLIPISEPSHLFVNPIAAIYTPFSFILVYEVYLLIYYLPKSTSIYVSKQYEIITLIVFRRLFKDLSNLDLVANWFNNKNDLQFTFDLITSLVLFLLIYLFHISHSKKQDSSNTPPETLHRIHRFVHVKKWMAIALVPLLFCISVYSLISWSSGIIEPDASDLSSLKNVNNIFFEEFFNILIITDVFLLLFSFFHTDHFHKVIRNSGFIISTILIRISFTVEGITNNVLIVSAVIFGLCVILIHNKFEKHSELDESSMSKELED